MNSLFALLVLVALVVCACAQWNHYGAYNSYAHTYPYGYSAPAAYNYGAYNGAYNYGAYNPALSYLWKK